MATLTDRYIFATVRSLGPESEADVRAELAASIADAVEARMERGEERASAERAVLTGLGDPGVLAAGYADRPLQLIGPRYFLTWWRLLKLLLCIVPATAVAGVVLGLTLDHASLGEVIGQAWATGLTTTVHVGFWTTLAFFILDRGVADAAPSWNVDQLPETVENQPGRNEVLLMAIYSALVVGALLWDRFRGFAQVDGEPVPILGGQSWPLLLGGFMILLAAKLALSFISCRQGRWTVAMAAANTVAAVAFAAFTLTLLVRQELINPDFVQQAFTHNNVGADVVYILAVLLGFSLAGFAVWDIIDGWRRLRKQK